MSVLQLYSSLAVMIKINVCSVHPTINFQKTYGRYVSIVDLTMKLDLASIQWYKDLCDPGEDYCC